MKRTSKLLFAGLAAFVLPVLSHAASVTWGSVQAITGASNIVSTGVTALAGANFGVTTGTTTIVNNGSVDVEFKSLRSGQSATLSNGITVAADSTWGNWGFAGGNSPVTGNFGVVLDSNLGIELNVPVSLFASITLSGLTIGTQYQIQFFADSTGNNGQTISGSGNMDSKNGQFVTGTFTADADSQVLTVTRATGNAQFAVANALTIGTAGSGPDTTSPAWIATWPQANPLSPTSLIARAKINEAGTAYYVVLADGAAAPSAAQVKAGTDSTGSPALAAGNLTLAATTEATTPVAGLSPSTAYDVWFVAQDAAASPNLQVSPIMVDATTLAPDTAPPAWIASWPQATQLSPTSLTVRAKIDETGAAYYVVLATGAAAPTAAQVKAGTDSAGAPALKSGPIPVTANTEATAPVTGLTTDTTYDLYFAAEDGVPNLQASPSLVSVSLVSTAVVTWGSVQTLTGANNIDSSGLTNIAGANFGVATGTTTTVLAAETGTVDVEFKSLRSGQNVTLSNGITVAADTQWVNWGFADGNSAVTGNFGIVLDSNLGIETGTPVSPSATITLSGLLSGTKYRIQFFADSTGTNTQTISDSGNMNTLNGQFVTGTFTAKGTSQVLTVTRATDFAVANALTIGVISGGGNTFADWIGGFTGLNGLTGFHDDADGDGLDNGVENVLGTAPNAGNAGLTAGVLSGNTFTFTHPQNATPASDVSAPAYTWSTDLQTFHASGASSGGITVNLVAAPNTPSTGTTTVTATVTGAVPSGLFVRLGVTQP